MKTPKDVATEVLQEVNKGYSYSDVQMKCSISLPAIEKAVAARDEEYRQAVVAGVRKIAEKTQPSILVAASDVLALPILQSPVPEPSAKGLLAADKILSLFNQTKVTKEDVARIFDELAGR